MPKQGTTILIHWIQKYALLLALVFASLINLDQLQVYREYAIDEVTIADAAYSISEYAEVPKLQYWSLIFPTEQVIDFQYPPLYFYVAGIFMRQFGAVPQAFGWLHLVIRVLTVAGVFVLFRRLKINPHWTLIACFWWASNTRIGFYTSRADDLAVLMVVLALISTTATEYPLRSAAVAGVWLGLAFLSHPVGLIIGMLLCGLSLLAQNRLTPRTLLVLLVSAGAVSCLWLLWILPFWSEFQSFFIGFVLPDAAAGNFLGSLTEHIKALILGVGPFFKVQSSLLPFLLLDIALCLNVVWKKQITLPRIGVMHLPLAVALLLISRNRIHPYAVTWLALMVVITTLMILHLVQSLPVAEMSVAKWIQVGCATIILIQAFSLLGFQGIRIYANALYQNNCLEEPLPSIRATIPTSEKVVSYNSLVYYAVRKQNPVYYPAGLSGVTPGGFPFAVAYDETHRWLVTTESLDQMEAFGGKFAWDEHTFDWFRQHYELSAKIGDAQSCFNRYPLARFSTAALPIYIYRYR